MINPLIHKFPDELVLNKVKDTNAFGEEYAKAIWAQEESALLKRRKQFKKNQLYADAIHPIDECESRIKGKFIEPGFLRINWESRLTFMHDQLIEMWNSVDFSEFRPLVYAIDPTAREIKNNRKNEKKKLLASKDFIQKMAQVTGQSPIPLDQIPQSEEQIEVEEQTAKPLDLETAEELVLDGTVQDNNFEEIQNIAFRDASIKGLGVAHASTDPIEGIKLRYVKPENFIFSPTRDRYFRDCKYFAEVVEMTLGEIKKIASRSKIPLTDGMIKDMFNDASLLITEETKIAVLCYTFKTFHKKILKVRKNRKTNAINIKDRTKDGYNPQLESDVSKKVEDVYDVWYEGMMTLTSKRKLISHNLVENMAEYNGKVFSPYMAFAPRMTENGFNSLVEKKIASIDKLQELDFRIQHMANELKGNITRVNPDTFSRVKLGDTFLTPEEVLSFYFTKYLAFDITTDAEGDPIQSKTAITETPAGIPYALRELASRFSDEYNQFLRSWGYSGANKQSPDPETLFESEPYRLSDNNTLRDYSTCAYRWTINIFQNISSRINDAISDKDLREKYVAMIGLDDVEVISEYSKRRADHYFGVFMDYVPTREERMLTIQNIQIYVKQGVLTPVDEMELRNTRNPKLAARILNLKIEARRKAAAEQEKAQADYVKNGNIESSNVSADNKIRIKEAEHRLKMEQSRMDFEDKFKLIQVQGQTDLTLEGAKSQHKGDVAKYTKDMEATLAKYKKDRDEEIRIKGIQESQKGQSYLIGQRKGEVPMLEGAQPNPQPEVDLSQLNNQDNGTI